MIKIHSINSAEQAKFNRRADLAEYEKAVRSILDAIRKQGDSALLRYARQFDALGDLPLRVTGDELREAAERMCPEVRKASELAIRNIRQFAEAQLPREYFEEFSPGRKLGWIVKPLEAVGCYVPSGRYPLTSTLLMTAVLAQTAGVSRICVASPKPSIEILGCAHLLGLREIYRIGGAHAIAAMTFGTETIVRVDRIVGPGNLYVSAAKKLLAGEVGIDFIAGPTEIVIVASDGNPRIIAADMLAQAEHDPSASAILITTSQSLADAVSSELEAQLRTLPTAPTAAQAIDNGSAIFITPDLDIAVELANRIAPEHLALYDAHLLPQIRNAGTIFLGQTSPESAGDYAAGPSHVLPTGGIARLRGGLSTADFVKLIAVQELSPSALADLAPVITALARAEGLEAHARSVEFRMESRHGC
ncbi:MAG: histidinol dehydrogenase [Acidobacteriaceae bacterium]|nr:histidinol dehydrogenase [Acidobacteriaceae bacterium]MBV9781680.1 histidinol dehydrogenase [Acidobacteriaceae bacterium]